MYNVFNLHIIFYFKRGAITGFGSIHYFTPDYFNLFLVRICFVFGHTYFYLEPRNHMHTLSFCCIPSLHGLIQCEVRNLSVSSHSWHIFLHYEKDQILHCFIFHLWASSFLLVISPTFLSINITSVKILSTWVIKVSWPY